MPDPRWKSYFTDFSPPWRFYSLLEYRKLLETAQFSITRIDVVPKQEYFPSRTAFHQFLKQWFPYLRPLPEELREAFLTALLDEYLHILPEDQSGRVGFLVDRLEVEATK